MMADFTHRSLHPKVDNYLSMNMHPLPLSIYMDHYVRGDGAACQDDGISIVAAALSTRMNSFISDIPFSKIQITADKKFHLLHISYGFL